MIFSVLLLISTHLCAMMESSDYIVDAREDNHSKKSASQLKKTHDISSHKQKLGNREQESSGNEYTSKSLSCWGNAWSCWKNIGHIWKELLGRHQNNSQSQEPYIYLLPDEIIWHIAKFLGSIDILRLSNTCKKFRQVFNGDYWNIYLSRVPKVYSYLVLNGSFSPSLDRKAFFSHLWYSEGLIHLAAKLNHPEALVLQEYGSYGAYISRDQYLCPSGFIRHASGMIDNERTDKLKEAEKKKAKADFQKNEILKKRQEQIINYNSKWDTKWRYFN